MAGLLCALAGARYASGIKKDAARLSRWVQLLHHLVLLLREGAMSIPEALCAAADESHIPDKLLREMAARLTALPMLTPAEAFSKHAPEGQEKAVLARMFHRLGRGSKESRILAVNQAADEITLLAKVACSRAEKDVRLWQTLGLTAGICLTILLI